MTKTRFTVLAIVTVGAGLAAATVVAPRMLGNPTVTPSTAMWVDHFDTVAELRSGVDTVIVATVLGTRAGRVVEGPGLTPLAFTLADLRVDRNVAGEPLTGLTVEQTGGRPGDTTLYVNGDGGPYLPGVQYLLFLNRQPDTDFFYLVNPQGRFAVQGGRLRAVAHDDPVAARLDGLTVDLAVRTILAAR